MHVRQLNCRPHLVQRHMSGNQSLLMLEEVNFGGLKDSLDTLVHLLLQMTAKANTLGFRCCIHNSGHGIS